METQQEEQPLPDTASPYDIYAPEPHTGWGRLIPINCTLAAKDLTDNIYVIGREKKCHVSFTEYDIDKTVYKQISKIHCKITREKISQDDDHIVFLEDLSSNGTYVNEVKIGKNERTIITGEDEISLVNPENKVFFFVDSAKTKMNWLPRDLSSKYHLLRHLGTGGFAEVKLVLEKKTLVKRAIKKLNKTGMEDPKIGNEISILQQLRHPCIVEMVDVDETKEAAFIVMEFVRNGNLLERLKKGGPLAESTAKLVFFQLAWAVDYLHSEGISHRDLKPENILISEQQNNLLIVKVADFGLSKVITSMSQLRTACGTLSYTAPEVLLNRGEGHYTNKVDVWGLGVVLFVCLSGRRPFHSKADEDPGLLVERILRGQYSLRTPEWKNVSIFAKLLISQLLTVKPEKRLSSDAILDDKWLKDPVLAKEIRTLFGHAAPVKDKEDMCVDEPPTKIPRLQAITS